MSENIINDALALPSDIRIKLIEKLIESLNLPTKKEIDQFWIEEAERRVSEIENGTVKTLPASEVLKEARERYQK